MAVEGIRAAGVYAEADFRIAQNAYRNFDKFEKKIDRLKKKLGELQSANFTVGGRAGSVGSGYGSSRGGYGRGWVGGLSDIAVAFRKREAMIKSTSIGLENSMRKMEISPDDINKARVSLEALNTKMREGKFITSEYKVQVKDLTKQLNIKSKANRDARVAEAKAQKAENPNAGLFGLKGPWMKKAYQQQRLIDQKESQFMRTTRSLGWDQQSKQFIEYRQRFDALVTSFKNSPADVNTFKKSIEGLDLQMRRTADNSFWNKSQKFFTSVRGGLIGAGIAGVGMLGASAVDTGKKFESLRAVMTTAFGKDSQKEIAFLRQESNRLGMDMLENAKSYTQIAFAMKLMKGNMADARKVFSVMGEASIAFGLDQEAISRSFKAIMQMYSKGVLTSEEMRQQLGDSLAGVMPMLAEAVGVPIEKLDEMMQKKMLTTDQFMMKFIDVLRRYSAPGVEAAMDNLQIAQNRTNNIWLEFKDEFFQGFKPLIISSLTTISELLKTFTPIFKFIGATLSLMLQPLVTLPGFITALVHDLWVLMGTGPKSSKMREEYGMAVKGWSVASAIDKYTDLLPHMAYAKGVAKVYLDILPSKEFDVKVREQARSSFVNIDVNSEE